MKITQISLDEVLNNITSPDIYRVCLCDDSNYGQRKKHFSARMRPVKNIPMIELFEHRDDPAYAYVVIDKDATV